MKFSLVFLLVVAFVAVQADEEVSQEGIWNRIGKAAKDNLAKLAKKVGKDILNHAKDIITDNFKLKPSAEFQEAATEVPSHEGIVYASPLTAFGGLIFHKANALSKEVPSHEGIKFDFGYLPKLHVAEDLVSDVYVEKNIAPPSQEGIFGNIGKLFIRGAGHLIGGNVGDAISKAGDFVGNLFFAVPPAPTSQEAIASDPETSQEGIFSSLGKIIQNGAGKVAGKVLNHVMENAGDVLGNIFMARGSYRSYHDYKHPAQEIIQYYRHHIHDFGHEHPEAKTCLKAAESNFTMLFNEFSRNGESCVHHGRRDSHLVFKEVRKMVVDAVQRVEHAHREAGYCFHSEERNSCLENDVPALVEKHMHEMRHYGYDLARYVRHFTLLNNNFDVCLTEHLGFVRTEVLLIVEDFHNCVSKLSTA